MTKVKEFHNESAVKKEVKKLLDKHGWFYWMPPANGFGRTGISDFNALKRGTFLALETKFGKNVASPMQKGFLTSIVAEDGLAFIVTEKNLGWFACFLIAFDKSSGAISAARAAGKTEQEAEGEVAPEDGAMMVNAIRELTQGY